ncbi:ABC transporter permease [Spirochaetia bacterium]|nr:ABC transporter permease [Spirochaetia bacterium]
MTWRLIFRNIIRNRKNSLVIFLLIALITALFFIGNSVMGQTNLGLKKTYIDSLTADVVIQKTTDMSMNLFGSNSPVIEEYGTIPVLPAYDTIVEMVSAEDGIECYTSQVSGRSLMQIPDLSHADELVLLCGVDAKSYFDCFPGITLEEGRFLEPGEYGVMMTRERADWLEEKYEIRPTAGMSALFTSAGVLGFKIREAPIVGIYRYENPGQFMNDIIIADPQTVRVLTEIQVAAAPISGIYEPDFFENPDDVFAEAGSSGGETPSSSSDNQDSDYRGEGFSPEELAGFLASFNEGETEISGGDWHFILIRLKKGVSAGAFTGKLNKKLVPWGVNAAGWRTAAGTSAIMMLLVQGFFNLGGFLVSVAGIIVVVNILLISVFRRTREIGTLRAIGASGAYIRFLIMGENCFLAFLAGIAGVIAGITFLGLINSMKINIPNELVASLLGGSVLHIGFLPLTAFVSFAIALVLGAAASVYPVETAVRIDPITAVRQG